MAKQQPIKSYISDTGAKGSWTQVVREGQGSQDATQHAGFRARKMAMHNQDGANDSDIEDRSGGDEPKTQSHPAMEEKEHPDEGTKEMNQTATHKKM